MRVSKNKKKKIAVVLLSGGIDSAATLHIAINRGFRPNALIFDYGQRHRKEIDFAKKIAKKAGCPYKILNLSFPLGRSSLLLTGAPVPASRSLKIKGGIPSTYVPGRNIIFLAIAASFAESIKAKAVFIGAHTEDYSGYPDCRKEFFDIFRKLIRTGTKDGRNIRIFTPLINKSKKEIVKKGLELGVPFRFTWSCYEGGKSPCGRCDSCFFRKKAFRELGMEDPYYGKG